MTTNSGFSYRIIAPLRSESGKGGLSGECFLAQGSDDHAYKVRRCSNKEKLCKYLKNMEAVRHLVFFPEIKCVNGTDMVIHFVDGRDARMDEPSSFFHELGALVAQLHKIKPGPANPSQRFYEKIDYLLCTGVLTVAQYDKLCDRYATLESEVNLQGSMELDDISPSNIRITPEGRIYFVDEPSLGHRAKGIGFARPYLKWFSPEQRSEFEKGYSLIADLSFFTKAYETLVSLVFLAGNTASRIHRNEPSYQASLRQMFLQIP